MGRAIVGVSSLVFICCLGFGQAPTPHFEVASVHPLDPDSGAPGSNVMRGGPGTEDPGRIAYISVTMQRLLMKAYGVRPEQISGPGWLDSARYAIAATVPLGAREEQLSLMLQNLIAERFHLKIHKETKDFPAYELVIAKNGSKLKPSGGDRPELSGRYTTRMEDGVSRLSFHAAPLSTLVAALNIPLGTMYGNIVSGGSVRDNTGLTGAYDFSLEFAGSMGPGGAVVPVASDPPAAPGLFMALETQLGLKLHETTAPREVLVIERIEKVPTPN